MDSKGSFYSAYTRSIVSITALVLAVMLLIVTVGAVYAQFGGCSGNVEVGGDGASCGTDVTNPGGGSETNNGGSSVPGTETGNNNNNNNNNNNGNGQGNACTPGTIVDGSFALPVGSSGIYVPSVGTVPLSPDSTYTLPDGSVVSANGIPADMCVSATTQIDSCTGEIVGDSFDLGGFGNYSVSGCPTSNTTTIEHPCDEFVVSGGGVTCVSDLTDSSSYPGSSFSLHAHAPWPGIEIHARPFPVTLVDWDSVMRVVGNGSSSGSDSLGYAPWGGGNQSNPAPGDWSNVRLRLDIKPVTDWADVFLENIGLIRMPIGRLHTFQWNLPSHPAAGGNDLSGVVGQLEELEPDVPLYANWTRAPYMVYCTLDYYEWGSSCVDGPDDGGTTNCRWSESLGAYTGHREWGWEHNSQTVPIPPTAARVDLPPSRLADLNGDGVPDAYWGGTSTVRRMDDAGRVDNPEWAHTYSWGYWWYWGVREAQGQIGWPGIPVDP